MPDITPSRYRSQANGIINLMGGLGALISFFIGASLFEINRSYPFWLGSILVIVAALLVFAFIKEPKEYQDAKKEETPGIIESLKELFRDEEKSPLFILMAILFWFISYNGIEAFFSLYGINHLNLTEGDSVRQLGFLSLIFLLFAIPSGYIGAKFGRRRTIMTGISLMALSIISMIILPNATLNSLVASLPVVGNLYVVGIILMIAGLSWALININSLPMVVDMTVDARIGTFTGLYYFASTLAAIAGPNIYGLIVRGFGNNYNLTIIVSPIFLIAALIMMSIVRRGEAKTE